MKNKKYELVEDDFIIHEGKKLYRIRSLRENINLLVHRGDKGGYIERYHNLSQEGDCWVYEKAKVYGNARVEDDAKVCGYAKVFGNARLEDDAFVGWNAQVYDNAVIKDGATIGNNAKNIRKCRDIWLC